MENLGVPLRSANKVLDKLDACHDRFLPVGHWFKGGSEVR